MRWREAYIVQPDGLKVGQKIVSGPRRTFWWERVAGCGIFRGTTIHNVELRPGKGAQMVRSAGGSAQLVAKKATMDL